MIAGLGGDLVSHAFVTQQLERQAASAADCEAPALFERRIVRWWRSVSRALGPASSARAVHDVAAVPLLELLGHVRPAAFGDPLGVGAALPRADSVLLSVPWQTATAAAWRDAVRRGVDRHASWALICNGRSLRIVDCRRSWSRAGIDFEFERLTIDPAGIRALRMLAGAAAFDGSATQSLRALVIASDADASNVCRALGDGVLSALPRLADALASARERTTARSSFDQALTLIYRVLFLLFAEARAMVPVWNDVYRGAYTIDALVDRACVGWEGDGFGRRHGSGLWHSLQAISRLAHSGCVAGDLHVTAFNGRLFSPRHAPLAEQRRIPDGVVRDVLLALATVVTRHGRRRISYHDLGVEQLGSVYERVLEYQPAKRGARMALERTSSQRKTTGSFYTPQMLTEYLVRRTLAPLLDRKPASQILRLRVLDPAMGSGAFLVAACRYLADRCELAMVRDGEWPGRMDETTARATLRRAIAERCLFGVDVNPTAVQLARVSLWLTTLAADRPLTFLDHHLATGNSLIGAWLADLSRAPRTRPLATRSTLPLFDAVIADDVSARVLPDRLRIALEPSDSIDTVRGKERALANLSRADGPLQRWTAAADAWCAAALWPGPPPSAGLVAEWIAAAAGEATTLPRAQLKASLERARVVAAEHAAFHWELAFPEVFFDADGRHSSTAGFDAVIGNPPWDMLRADTGSSTDRDQSRSATAAAMRFFRTSGAYSRQGQGHANRYQLFVERALQLVKPGGRLGLLVPSGIATDHGSAAIRRHLLDRTAIDSWIGLDNRRRIFPIHRSVRFVLLSTTNEGSTDVLRFRCGVTDPATLYADDADQQALSLSRSRIEALSPEHLAIPEIGNATALAILTGVSQRVPPLGDAAGWHVRFGRELNATDDRPHFVPAATARHSALRVVEGKQLAPFTIDLTRSQSAIPRKAAAALLDPAATFERSRIAYRDVASATNKLTLIAAMLPAGTISTHTVFCQKTRLEDDEQWCLLGLMNSLVANYLVRLQVTTHVTTSLMSRLPVPKPAASIRNRIATLSRDLAKTGIEAAPDAYAALNSLAAREYGVTPDDYAHIIASFPLLPQSLRERCHGA